VKFDSGEARNGQPFRRDPNDVRSKSELHRHIYDVLCRRDVRTKSWCEELEIAFTAPHGMKFDKQSTLRDNGWLIIDVDPDSEAWVKGIRNNWVLDSIDGIPIDGECKHAICKYVSRTIRDQRLLDGKKRWRGK